MMTQLNRLSIVVAAGFLSLATLLPADTYIVDNQHPRAADANPGTREAPLLTVSAADLVTENAADECTGDGTRDVGTGSLLWHLLAFYPAPLFRRPQHRPHGRYIRLEQRLVVTSLVTVHCHGNGTITVIGGRHVFAAHRMG